MKSNNLHQQISWFQFSDSQLDTHCRLKVVQFLHKEYSVNIAVDYVSITAILHNFDLQ